PLEEAAGRFWFKDGLPDVRRSSMAFASSLNPLIRGPLEQLAGTQFFSGRPLGELQPSATASAVGRLVGDDNPTTPSRILANTPAGRFLGTRDKMIDGQKGLPGKLASLATGVNLATVDLDRAKHGEARQAVADILSHSPRLKRHQVYAPRSGMAELLTPV